VYHGRSSYQIGLELGRLHHGDRYSLHELLTAVAPDEVGRARCQTSDPKVLERCLSAIADVVAKKCGPLLGGDAVSFENLRSSVAPMRKTATLQARFGAILDRADQAWEAKDLRLATDLYQQAEPALNETRCRRLKYLRHKKVIE
jgi:hypothetical protein